MGPDYRTFELYDMNGLKVDLPVTNVRVDLCLGDLARAVVELEGVEVEAEAKLSVHFGITKRSPQKKLEHVEAMAIAELRRDPTLSKKEIAERVGVPRTTLSGRAQAFQAEWLRLKRGKRPACDPDANENTDD